MFGLKLKLFREVEIIVLVLGELVLFNKVFKLFNLLFLLEGVFLSMFVKLGKRLLFLCNLVWFVLFLLVCSRVSKLLLEELGFLFKILMKGFFLWVFGLSFSRLGKLLLFFFNVFMLIKLVLMGFLLENFGRNLFLFCLGKSFVFFVCNFKRKLRLLVLVFLFFGKIFLVVSLGVGVFVFRFVSRFLDRFKLLLELDVKERLLLRFFNFFRVLVFVGVLLNKGSLGVDCFLVNLVKN